MAIASALILAGCAATAQMASTPLVFADSPPGRSAWRVEVQQAPGPDGRFAKDAGPITLCTTAAELISRSRDTEAPARARPECKRTLVEDGAERAVMQVQCAGPEGRSVMSTVLRVAPQRYQLTSEVSSARRARPVVLRMTLSYAGACSAKVTTTEPQPERTPP
jgi:hypothetical protein